MNLLIAIGGIEIFIILFAFLFALLLPLIALIDILKSKFEGNDKLIWVLVVVVTNILGVILYFTIGRTQKINNVNQG